MAPKKQPEPAVADDYVYAENLSVRVKERAENQNATLDNYFGSLLRDGIVIDQNNKYCSLCLQLHIIKRYKATTSTGNLRNHLSGKHQVNLEHKLTDRNQRKVTDMLLAVGKEQNIVGSATDSRFILARQICLWFCRDLLAFNTIAKSGIRDFCVYAGLIKNNEKLPDRTTLADTALNDIYFALLAYIKKFVGTLPKTLTTSMDFWTDNVKRVSYINYWIHWIDSEFRMQKLCLGIKRFPHPHTGKEIASAFKNVMEEFKLENKKFLAVTDNGGNIKLACKLLKLEREPCLCHNLHLLVATDLIKDHIELKPIRDLITVMKKLKKTLIYKYEELKQINDVEYNKRLHHLVSSLENISDILECTEVLITEFGEEDEDNLLLVDFCNEQTRRDTTFTTIKNSNATRWNSVRSMFNSFIENVDTINNCLATMKRYDLCLSDEDLQLATDFVKVLDVFSKATDLMQGDSYPSLNLAVCCYVDIKADLTKLLASEKNSSIIQISASFLLEKLDERFPITENMIVAAFLDPSMHKLPIISAYCRANYVDMLSLLVKKWIEYEPELKQQPAKVSAPKNFSRVSTLRMELLEKHIGIGIGNVSDDGFEAQIQKEYLKYTSIDDMVPDPLIWWKTHENSFPYLSALARVMLSIPASSGVTEHHFSETGYLINKKKANLDSFTAEKVMFVHDNFKHISDSI